MIFPGSDLTIPGASPHLRLLDIPLLHETHLSALLEIYCLSEDFLALGAQPKASLAMVKSDLAHARAAGRFFCAVYRGEDLAGVVDFLPAGHNGDLNRAWVELLMIASPYRSRGLGRQVVSAVECYISSFNSPGIARSQITVQLAVQVNNPRAMRFWQRCGYCVISTPTPQPDATITCLFGKNLSI
jgi:GNAT superfamily N-acetyltransferase